jgi:hypothetical protein
VFTPVPTATEHLQSLSGSADLWLVLATAVHMLPGITPKKEGDMDEDPMASVFGAITAGMNEDQVMMLRRLVTAHMTFLAGLLQAADTNER